MKILFLDQNRTIGELLRSRLASSGWTAPDGSLFDVDIEIDYDHARTILTSGHRYDAAVIESSTEAAANGVALDIVDKLRGKLTLTVILTALPSLEDCIGYMRAGAWDYIAKSGSIDQIAQRLVTGFERAARDRPLADPDALYVEEHFSKLVAEHAERWIAIGRGQFLGAADSYEELVTTVETMPVKPKFWRMPPRPRGL